MKLTRRWVFFSFILTFLSALTISPAAAQLSETAQWMADLPGMR